MNHRSLSRHALLSIATLCVLPAIALAQDVAVNQQFVQLEPAGVGSLDHGPASPPTSLGRNLEIRAVNVDGLTQIRQLAGAARTAAAALAFPTVRNSPVTPSHQNSFGFDGLNHADQRLAGNGPYANTQFSTEPPDQGLCVGNGFALETVNTALAVFRRDTGSLASGPTSLSQFFGLAPEVVRSTPPVFGDFISDPRCHYDAQTNRFFLTILQIGVDPQTGNLLLDSSVLIAVSQTGDPTGHWNLFRLHTTNHGVGCPCFPDQPLIGFDANGFYISGNAFSIAGSGYGGNQIYAMSKSFLAAGLPPPFVLHIALPPVFRTDGSLDFSMHPAIHTRGQEQAHFGTEYFLSSFDITSELENQLVVWALRNTALLNSPPGPQTTFSLLRRVVPSEVYGVPPDAIQKRGPLVLGPQVDPNVFEIVATNEHRMQQVTFANGHLWSGVTTGLTSPGENSLKAGVAWFSVQVDAEDNQLRAEVDRQGYVAIANGSVFFPAVGVNSAGNAAIGFSLASPKLFPSTGYVTLAQNSAPPGIHIAGAGVASEDGFSGYPDATSVPPPCLALPDNTQLCEARWGDYGAAAVDEDGSIWLANQYIGPRPRTLLANWGTFLIRLGPGNGN